MNQYWKDVIWTYGSHEPMSMYLRGRRLWTAGLKGGALWAAKWHEEYDSEENVKKMASLGLNFLLSRFYKGMGWEFEKEDFKKVQKFVGYCRKYNIRTLGYVQYGSLYFEHLKYEIPNLEDWAAKRSDGTPTPYIDDDSFYYRWMPCPSQDKYLDYLEKILDIGMEEGDFDGFLLDNCLGSACYCPRCKAKFREYLKKNCKAEEFGLPGFDFVEPPTEEACEAPEWEDPVLIAWKNFQAELFYKAFKRLYDHVKQKAPHLLFTANVPALRRISAFRHWGQDYTLLKDCFDFIMDQNGNEPMFLDNGAVISRVRCTMLGEALGKDLFVNTDGGAEPNTTRPEVYAASIMDAKVFQSVTSDRIIMTPERNGVPRWKIYPEREQALRQFQKVSASFDKEFYAPNYAPVALLYSTISQHLSVASFHALLSAEETLLRSHIPYRLIVSRGEGFEVPENCKDLLLFGAKCLSSRDLASVQKFLDRKGNVIADMMAGDCNEENRQYETNPFAGMPQVKRVKCLESNVPDPDWRFEVLMPGNPEVILDNLSPLPFRIFAPETVLTRINETQEEYIIHFINYTAKPCTGTKITFSGTAAEHLYADFETGEWQTITGQKTVSLPDYLSWCVVKIKK
ncbi:MAG: hypothetical protein IKA79_06020 [Lentisphaeria bacterium]|nr:hypothetical protein [Lentisphaeria bacterium]